MMLECRCRCIDSAHEPQPMMQTAPRLPLWTTTIYFSSGATKLHIIPHSFFFSNLKRLRWHHTLWHVCVCVCHLTPHVHLPDHPAAINVSTAAVAVKARSNYLIEWTLKTLALERKRSRMYRTLQLDQTPQRLPSSHSPRGLSAVKIQRNYFHTSEINRTVFSYSGEAVISLSTSICNIFLSHAALALKSGFLPRLN